MTSAVLLFLFVTLMLTDALEPCQDKKIDGYDRFEKRHILSEDFDRNSADAWVKYLKAKGLCGRVKNQSFINKADTDKVKDICNGKGVRDSGDLCISEDEFTMYNVESVLDHGQCVVKKVDKWDGQHVVVACDLVENQCLPVHYQTQTNTPPTYGEICKPKTQ